MYEDKWVTLAKLIYSMTREEQCKFRFSFPPGITDWQLDDAIEFAKGLVVCR